MAEQSNIEWTDSTFNPWEGCTKIGPGCDNCYAENRNARFGGGESPNWGPGKPRRRTSEANWKKPLKWNDEPFYQCRSCGHRSSETHPMINCCKKCQGLLLKVRRRVFCASLADVFDNEVPPSWLNDLFHLIGNTPNLDWLLLTKRIGNVPGRLRQIARESLHDNVWLGITVVNQEEADRDIPKLLKIPAKIKFLSMEPLLGEVDLTAIRQFSQTANNVAYSNCLTGTVRINGEILTAKSKINWVIVGGESGHQARPMQSDWVRSLQKQCKAAGTPFLFKQWGEYAPNWYNDVAGEKIPGSEWMDRFGKKKAGRELDGETHTEFPKFQ